MLIKVDFHTVPPKLGQRLQNNPTRNGNGLKMLGIVNDIYRDGRI